ncbi:MAG: GspH/FimT family pseudopilin [Steroidobacteraceae bacterium]|nr:GspH/FimT family pseudopilin [Steroidobacteraceae bacterium]
MKAKQSGFTLIELMFVVMLAALLLGLGIPSFRDFIRNGRITTAANDMVADYNLARSESVKRRVPVTLCKSDDGATCDGDEDTPFVGWLVFVDDANPIAAAATDGNGAVDANEDILRVRSIPDTIDVGADGVVTTFLPSGFPDDTPGPTATPLVPLTQVVMCDDRGNEISTGGVSAARGLSISATGRTTISRDQDYIEDELGGCP